MTVAMSKRPADVLDYSVDFFRWLSDGDQIVAANATITGGTSAIDTTTHSATAVKVWVSGGEPGETATVKVTINTQQGRTREECFRLRIEGCPQ